jgi:DNA modification methylase
MTTTVKKAAAKGKKTSAFVPIFVGSEPEMVKLESLKPNDWNPNQLTSDEKKALAKTLRTKGWSRSQSMLVWATDEKGRRMNVIIDGEHRWAEAKKLGYIEGPAVMLNRTARADAVAWTLRIDKIRGRFNDKKVAKVLADEFGIFKHEDRIELGLDLGFSGVELDALSAMIPTLAIDDGAGANANSEDELIPEPPKKPVTQLGDVWVLGDHRLICGDCFVPEVRTKCFDKVKHLDFVVTDPPYAIYGSSTGIGADIADDNMVRPFFESLLKLAASAVPYFGHIYVCCDWRSWASIWDSARRALLTVKNLIVWDKGGSGLGSNYSNCYELVGFMSRLPAATAMKSSTHTGQRTVHRPNLVRFNRVTGDDRMHNAAKPVEMVRGFVRNSSDRGEVGADFFAGSGPLVIACEREERIARVFEKEPKNCDVIVERWSRLTGKGAKRA